MMRPARPVRRRHMADLARHQPQPAAMERAAERNRHLGIAIPAQFEHGRLESRKRQRGGKTGCRAAGVDHQTRSRPAPLRAPQSSTPSLPASSARAGLISTSVTCAPASCAAQIGSQGADHAGADDRDAAGRQRLGIPDRVERGFHIGGKHGARRRHAIGQRHHGARWNIKQALMRMQHKHGAGRPGSPAQPRRGRRSSSRISPEMGSRRP